MLFIKFGHHLAKVLLVEVMTIPFFLLMDLRLRRYGEIILGIASGFCISLVFPIPPPLPPTSSIRVGSVIFASCVL